MVLHITTWLTQEHGITTWLFMAPAAKAIAAAVKLVEVSEDLTLRNNIYLQTPQVCSKTS